MSLLRLSCVNKARHANGLLLKWALPPTISTIWLRLHVASKEKWSSDRRGETIILTRRPIGVVAGILPWNFPFFLIARKAGASLIAGCTIVMKPSQLTPENCCTFAEVVEEAGLPAGVINIVTGKGSVVGHAMAASPKIDVVSVTGSVSAGPKHHGCCQREHH